MCVRTRFILIAYVREYMCISVVSLSFVKMSVPTNAFVVSSDHARVWGSIVSLSRRYLPATSWKLVRFGFPGSYIANLVGSRDRRNDRFDRSWIFARCSSPSFHPPPSRPVPLPLAALFLFSLYRRTYSVPLVFIGTNGTLWRPVTLPCRSSWALLSSSSCNRRPAIPIRIGFYIGKNVGQPPRNPARTFSTAKLFTQLLKFCWFARIQILSQKRVFRLCFESVIRPTPRILDGKVTE